MKFFTYLGKTVSFKGITKKSYSAHNYEPTLRVTFIVETFRESNILFLPVFSLYTIIHAFLKSVILECRMLKK